MTPLDAATGVLLVALCGHVGVLGVSLGRILLPQRRSRERALGFVAGAAAVLGELLALKSLLGKPASLAWVGGLLVVGFGLGLYGRGLWRSHPAGRAAFHAVVAAPLVILFVVVLNLR